MHYIEIKISEYLKYWCLNIILRSNTAQNSALIQCQQQKCKCLKSHILKRLNIMVQCYTISKAISTQSIFRIFRAKGTKKQWVENNVHVKI